MKSILVAFLSVAFTTGLVCAAEKPKKAKEPEVLVVADAWVNVPEGLRPSPGKPIYYVLGKTQLSLGESVAGIKMPNPADLERAVVSALASQGFVRTAVGGPLPALFIIASWGDANFANLDYIDESLDPDLQRAMARTSPRERDRQQIETLVGTRKLERHFLPPGDMEKIAAASNEDRLYVSLAALDAMAFHEKKKVLLWRTSVTIDARNKLADVLPIMLASAAPFFGRNADTPVFVDENYRRKFEVNVGEVKVVPEEKSEAAPKAKN